ncbi:MAG: trans-aconitate 2-methyltransferase [Hyphomicrobiales bacterium]
MSDWNPTQYLAFADERARPALDLIAHLHARAPRLIHDIGCGPGNSTALLRQAFPQTMLTGLDSSPAMIEKARAVLPGVAFSVGDVADWLPHPEADLVFANALFQWLPDHVVIIRRILDALRPGAVLALQVPDNLNEPSHLSMRKVAARPEFAGKLKGADGARAQILSAQGYAQVLRNHAGAIDVWRTTYHHPLKGHQAIAELFASTGLKPFIDPLGLADRKAFLAAYVKAIAPHYPLMDDGTLLFPFPRLFVVAVR